MLFSVQRSSKQTVGGVVGLFSRIRTRDEEYWLVLFFRINISQNEKGEIGSVAGWFSSEACIRSCYSDNKMLSLFGIGYSGSSNRKLLGKALLSENNYIGFDFENVWNMTEDCPKLIAQIKDDKQLYYEEQFSYSDKVEEREQSTKKEIETQNTVETSSTTETQIVTEKNQDESVTEAESKQVTEKDEKATTKSVEERTEQNQEKSKVTTENVIVPKLTTIDANEISSNDFTYTTSETEATITGYTGNADNLIIPETIDAYTVTRIDNNAFENGSMLQVIFPKTIKEIGDSAFANCTSLQTVTMADNTEEGYEAKVGNLVFSGCTSLASVHLSENVVSLGARFIENTAVNSITIPKNVRESGMLANGVSPSLKYNGALANCEALTEVVFEEGMTAIPDNIMRNESYTSHVKKVELPETVEEIGDNAFKGNGELETDRVPSKTEMIGGNAFDGCASIDEY